jgi:hypothetical protein
MGYPTFYYDNRMDDGVPAASSTAAGDYSPLNLRDWRPFTWWKPSAMPATVRVDCGVRRRADYAMLQGVFDQVQVVGSNDNWASEEVLVSSNVLMSTKDLTNITYWIPSGAAAGIQVTPNAGIAPDGSNTATRINLSGAANDRLDQAVAVAADGAGWYTYSVWLKGSGQINIGLNSTTGAAGNSEATVDLTSTWKRFSVSALFSIGDTGNIRIHSVIDRTGLHTQDIYMWGLQLVAGQNMLPYRATPDTSGGGMLLPFAAPDKALRLDLAYGTAFANSAASVPNVIGDIDIRVKFRLDVTPAGAEVYIFTRGWNARSWLFTIGVGGFMTFYMYSDGTNLTASYPASTAVLPIAVGETAWAKITRVAATGVSNFYYSRDGKTWTQLGAANRPSTPGNLYSSSEGYRAGGLGTSQERGHIYYAEVRNGIGGALSAVFDAGDAAVGGAQTFVSKRTGETWTVNSPGYIERTGYRYYGLRCTDAAAPSLSIAAIGEALASPQYLDGEFDPTKRDAHTQDNKNMNGQAIGRSVYYESWKGSVRLKNVPWSWARESFIPAWKNALRGRPFVFCWEPDLYPEDAKLVTAGATIETPHRSGQFADVVLEMEGVTT